MKYLLTIFRFKNNNKIIQYSVKHVHRVFDFIGGAVGAVGAVAPSAVA